MQPLKRTLLASTTLLLALFNHAGAQHFPSGGLTPSRDVLARNGLVQAWWGQAEMNPAQETVRYLTADEEVVYVQSSGGAVTAFDLLSGAQRWSIRLGRAGQMGYRGTSNADLFVVPYGMTLYAIDKRSGEIRWDFQLPSYPATGVDIDDRWVYFAGVDGGVRAYDLGRIFTLHREGLLPQWAYQTVAWRFNLAGDLVSAPIASDGIVNLASRRGSLYSLGAGDEIELKFQFEIDSRISAPLGASGEYAYVASQDHHLYEVNRNTGQLRRDFVTGRPVNRQPQVIGSDVFLLTAGNELYVLDKEAGVERWTRPAMTQFLAATPSRVYAVDELNNLCILSRDTGSLQGKLPFTQLPVGMANDRTDRVILANERGFIVCLHQPEYEFPLYLKHPDRKPILPHLAPESTE